MIENLRIRNFTLFEDIDVKFSPKINIIVGENSTGKTHILKLAYAMCLLGAYLQSNPGARRREAGEFLYQKLNGLFQFSSERLKDLVRTGSDARVEISYLFDGGNEIAAAFGPRSDRVEIAKSKESSRIPGGATLIPTKEIVSIANVFLRRKFDLATIRAIFDDSYLDLVEKAITRLDSSAEERIDHNPRIASMVEPISRLLGGRFEFLNGKGLVLRRGTYEDRPVNRSKSSAGMMYQDNSMLRFVPTSEPTCPSVLTAEGFRKLGVLLRLLETGGIGGEFAGPILWDEPETNLNPNLMRSLVEVLLELARNGQQVIVATHDYVFLKWYDVLRDSGKGDHLRFHSIYRDSLGKIALQSFDDYREIEQNPIAEAYNEIMSEQARRTLGGLGK